MKIFLVSLFGLVSTGRENQMGVGLALLYTNCKAGGNKPCSIKSTGSFRIKNETKKNIFEQNKFTISREYFNHLWFWNNHNVY